MGRGGRGSLQPEHGSHRARVHGRRRIFSGWGYQGRRCVSSSLPSTVPKHPITNTQLPPITTNHRPISHTNLPYRCRGLGRANGRVRVRIPGVTRGRGHGGPGGHRTGPGRTRASRNQSFEQLFKFNLNPALVLTASSAPGDGRVRLWDVRTGPRETAAALGGHVGGVTAVSPSPNGQAGSGGAFFTGEFLL